MKNIELLAPAGGPEALSAALAEGADAVYLGLKTFNAGLAAPNFAFNQFEAALNVCHRQGKKIYAAVNAVFEERETDRMYQFLQYLEKVGTDGIIVADFGVAQMVREFFPKLKLHASNQLGTMSSRAANFLSRNGFSRAVLARELSLTEIATIAKNTNVELAMFVHGSFCPSLGGTCLFSSYLGGKSANRGVCTAPCRRSYKNEDAEGYFFSPSDLQLVEHLQAIMNAGVTVLKLEGQLKSAEYVGTVVRAYRHMIDKCYINEESARDEALDILRADFARPKTVFNLSGELDSNFIAAQQDAGIGIPLGKIKEVRAIEGERYALIDKAQAYKINYGDSLHIHHHLAGGRSTVKVRDVKQVTRTSLLLKLEGAMEIGDELYVIQSAKLAKRWEPILPHDLRRYHQFPSHDKARRPNFNFDRASYQKRGRKNLQALPDGYYVLVDEVADLYTILTVRPTRALILFDRKNARGLRKHEAELPFKRENLIFWLPPLAPESDSEFTYSELEYWIGRGQKCFVANNIAHLNMLRLLKAENEITIIAGPYLYSFNNYAINFLAEAGAQYFIPPLEISKQNFFKQLENSQGSLPTEALLFTIFAYPSLFEMRPNLTQFHEESNFRDREGGHFELIGREDSSSLISSEAFSLIDRIPYLEKEGVRKFLLDFSRIKLQKPFYKEVLKATQSYTVLPRTSRFNWKRGFWQAPEAITLAADRKK